MARYYTLTYTDSATTDTTSKIIVPDAIANTEDDPILIEKKYSDGSPLDYWDDHNEDIPFKYVRRCKKCNFNFYTNRKKRQVCNLCR